MSDNQATPYQPYHVPAPGNQERGNNDLESHEPAEPYIPNGYPSDPGSQWREKS